MRFIKVLVLGGYLCFGGTSLWALPIGFNHNQGSLNYEELSSREFTLYHDARTPNEAQLTLESLTVAKPILQNWLAVERRRKLPVVMTAEVAGASFANFITDAIELQTSGMGTRDLAWHELTHTIMYEHLLNILGPAGAIIHLAWMPSWFLEGLAESTSVSINSAIQAGFERFQGLSGKWPSYESLHSLYSGYTDSYLGYAISGSFVSYLIRREALAANMPALLSDFYYNSMPWMWPWALIPYNPFLPMDDALHDHTQKRGRELYEQYKTAAMQHWQKNNPGVFIYNKPGAKADLSFLSRLQLVDNKLQSTVLYDGDLHVAELQFDGQSGWGTNYQRVKTMPEEAELRFFSKRGSRYLYARPLKNAERKFGFEIFKMVKNKPQVLITAPGQLIRMFETKSTISFISHDGETFKLCSLPVNNIKRAKKLPISDLLCQVEISQPRLIHVLGEKNYSGSSLTEEFYLGVTEQDVHQDKYSMIIWSPDSTNRELAHHKFTERPVSAARLDQQFWITFEGTSFYALRQYDSALQKCTGQINISDVPLQLVAAGDNKQLVLRLLHGADDHFYKFDPHTLAKAAACSAIGQHTSPLLYAANQNPGMTMQKAYKDTDYWTTPVQIITKHEKKVAQFNAAGAQNEDARPESVPAGLRLRPVFAVPWIGGDSAGYNYGILSVPLMDEMQNWTMQLTALYGTESRFPTTQLSTYYTGFWPRLQLDTFRYQTWNGVYRETEDGPLQSSYLDERGLRFHVKMEHLAWASVFNLGLKSVVLKKYQGPSGRTGRLNEFFAESSKAIRFGNWTWSNRLNLAIVPEDLNENFAYNSAEVASTLLKKFYGLGRTHRFTLGLQYNITRGKKVRRLRESYRPLRIYIPDGAGGLNNISIPVISGGGLFSATFGDTAARSKIDYSFPLIQNIDSLVRLFYIHELKFSAFLNYGGAWYQEPFPSDASNLIAAHGYTLDLLFDLKGINFNLGGGTGQVFGEPFEVYFTFGFDQIF